MKNRVAVKTLIIDNYRQTILPSNTNWYSQKQLMKLEKQIEKTDETHIGCQVVEHIKGDHHSMAFHTKIDDITIVIFRSDWTKEENNKNLKAILDVFGNKVKFSKYEKEIFQLET